MIDTTRCDGCGQPIAKHDGNWMHHYIEDKQEPRFMWDYCNDALFNSPWVKLFGQKEQFQMVPRARPAVVRDRPALLDLKRRLLEDLSNTPLDQKRKRKKLMRLVELTEYQIEHGLPKGWWRRWHLGM